MHVQFRALAVPVGAPGFDGVHDAVGEAVAAVLGADVHLVDDERVAAREHRRTRRDRGERIRGEPRRGVERRRRDRVRVADRRVLERGRPLGRASLAVALGGGDDGQRVVAVVLVAAVRDVRLADRVQVGRERVVRVQFLHLEGERQPAVVVERPDLAVSEWTNVHV